MEWGTPVKYISNFHFKEGLFVGYESRGGRVYDEVSLVIPKGKSSAILVNTGDLIKKPFREYEYKPDFNKKAWSPFKED